MLRRVNIASLNCKLRDYILKYCNYFLYVSLLNFILLQTYGIRMKTALLLLCVLIFVAAIPAMGIKPRRLKMDTEKGLDVSSLDDRGM